MRINAPQSVEGHRVWDLAIKCNRQLRVGPSGVFGYDMGAVLAMGQALGVPAAAIAEFMPQIEAAAVAAWRDQLKTDRT